MTIPLPIIAEVFRCTLVWDIGGASPVPANVIHLHASTTGQHASDAFSILSANVTAGMWAATSPGYGIGHVNIIKLDGTSATTIFATDASAKWKGSGLTGDPIPQVCSLIKIQTGARGRQNRGRVYIPYVSEADAVGGILLGGPISSLQSAWTSFITALNAATPVSWQLGVASYDRGHGGASAHFTQASAIVAETYTATQRRRQPGRKVSRH